MTDDKIRSRVWSGVVRVQVRLADTSAGSQETPSYFFEAHRNSYFPFYYNKFAQFFSPYVGVPDRSQNDNEVSTDSKGPPENHAADNHKLQFKDIWLEFEGVPLKWNYPVGLLWDYLIGPKGNSGPWWRIVLHTDSYPLDHVLPIDSIGTVEAHWMNQIKESCYIQNGSAKKIMNLSREDSLSLWAHTRSRRYDQLKQIYFRKVAPAGPAELKRVPLRIYLPFSTSNIVFQEPVGPWDADTGSPVTLRQVLHRCLPDLFSLDGSTKGHQGATERLGRAVVQGVSVALDVPLAELYYVMVSLDGFLHVCVAIDL